MRGARNRMNVKWPCRRRSIVGSFLDALALRCQDLTPRNTFIAVFCQQMLDCGSMTAPYLLKLVFRTVQTDPSCVQEIQGTPVRVILHRTFRCRHFSQATEARERRVDIMMSLDTIRCQCRCGASQRSRYLGELARRRVGAKTIEPRYPKLLFQFVTQVV